MGFEQILQTRSSFVRYTVRHRSGRHGVLCSRQCVPLLQRQRIDAAAPRRRRATGPAPPASQLLGPRA
jgi:hypothetical protein